MGIGSGAFLSATPLVDGHCQRPIVTTQWQRTGVIVLRFSLSLSLYLFIFIYSICWHWKNIIILLLSYLLAFIVRAGLSVRCNWLPGLLYVVRGATARCRYYSNAPCSQYVVRATTARWRQLTTSVGSGLS